MPDHKTAFSSPVTRCTVLLSVFVLLAAITLNVVSLALPNWVQFQVDRTKPGANYTIAFEFYTRNRGVFLTCLTDTAAAVLQVPAYADQVKFGTCLDMDLGNLNITKIGYVGSDGGYYLLMLRRLHLGLHLASGFVLCMALLACLVSVGLADFSKLFISAGLSLLAGGLQFGALVAFHHDLLSEILPPTEGTMSRGPNVYNAWPEYLKQATLVTPGASYYIALAAFGACLISGGVNMTCAATASACGRGGRDNGDDDRDKGGRRHKAGKANGAGVQPTRMDNLSNLSGGANVSVQSAGRLPRIPVYQSYGAY